MNAPSPQPIPRGAFVAVGALVVAVLLLVVLSLRKPELPVFAPTPIDAAAGPVGAGDHLLTIDSSDPETWRYADLARGTVVLDPGTGWDLAFRRFEVRVNGGAGSSGAGGVVDLGAVAFDSVTRLPTEGYRGMEAAGRDTTNAVLDRWYRYSYTSHILTPKDRTLAVRTHDGRRVALRFLSYYCPGAQPGCVTVRYRFFESDSLSG